MMKKKESRLKRSLKSMMSSSKNLEPPPLAPRTTKPAKCAEIEDYIEDSDDDDGEWDDFSDEGEEEEEVQPPVMDLGNQIYYQDRKPNDGSVDDGNYEEPELPPDFRPPAQSPRKDQEWSDGLSSRSERPPLPLPSLIDDWEAENMKNTPRSRRFVPVPNPTSPVRPDPVPEDMYEKPPDEVDFPPPPRPRRGVPIPKFTPDVPHNAKCDDDDSYEKTDEEPPVPPRGRRPALRPPVHENGSPPSAAPPRGFRSAAPVPPPPAVDDEAGKSVEKKRLLAISANSPRAIPQRSATPSPPPSPPPLREQENESDNRDKTPPVKSFLSNEGNSPAPLSVKKKMKPKASSTSSHPKELKAAEGSGLPRRSKENEPTRAPPEPRTCSTHDSNDITVQPWYFGDLERHEANSKLQATKEDGTYLVRDSTRGNQPYTLCILLRKETYNIPIRKRPDGNFALGTQKADEHIFNTVNDLVKFHQNNPIELSKGGTIAGKVKLLNIAPS